MTKYTHDPSIKEYRPFMVEANKRVGAIKPDKIEWLLKVWQPYNNHGWKSYEVRRNSGTEMSKPDKKANGVGGGRMSNELWDAMTDKARAAPVSVLDELFLTAGRLHSLERLKQDLAAEPDYIREMFPMLELETDLACPAAQKRKKKLMTREEFIANFPLSDCDKNACACFVHPSEGTKKQRTHALKTAKYVQPNKPFNGWYLLISIVSIMVIFAVLIA